MQFIEFEGRKGFFLEETEAKAIAALLAVSGLSLIYFPKARRTAAKFFEAFLKKDLGIQ